MSLRPQYLAAEKQVVTVCQDTCCLPAHTESFDEKTTGNGFAGMHCRLGLAEDRRPVAVPVCSSCVRTRPSLTWTIKPSVLQASERCETALVAMKSDRGMCFASLRTLCVRALAQVRDGIQPCAAVLIRQSTCLPWLSSSRAKLVQRIRNQVHNPVS